MFIHLVENFKLCFSVSFLDFHLLRSLNRTAYLCTSSLLLSLARSFTPTDREQILFLFTALSCCFYDIICMSVYSNEFYFPGLTPCSQWKLTDVSRNISLLHSGSKKQETSMRQTVATSQEVELFIFTAMNTSNPKFLYFILFPEEHFLSDTNTA
jgi:hypothetical protein